MTRGSTPTRYEEETENTWNCGSWFEYLLIVILSTILLIGVLVLTLFWVIYYRGGFAWTENPTLQFNLHPVLMIAGFITFSGFSILLYRLCRCLKHIYVKLAHMFFHACAIPCIVVGFLAVFDSHNLQEPPLPNFYSLHSWLGFVTMGLFALQFIVGFFSFLVLLCCENATYGCRAAMVPIHASFGLVNFMLAIATCVTGLTEKVISAQFPEAEKIVMNSLGMVLVAIGIVVSVAVRRSNAPATAKVYVTERL
ncbi:probable ascorbate-specific transmembrane electron transporter 2 isoform X3 [Hermetia illucens]|uniref:probable ascorbate-specific transmembrane electron transporter 2 isoform X3 n=1 Tax=Hermetia illucens TaxID=343691 RepID=UPI0018CC72BB|nr:probable ascorbate-specific transmembrane electron transporter 2 isoform X3 [Hermetia illucens]XP_037922646.1 probable ascorbate-specific transmembrane electron transporter 2 isoform X3 [Hermetia illucens]